MEIKIGIIFIKFKSYIFMRYIDFPDRGLCVGTPVMIYPWGGCMTCHRCKNQQNPLCLQGAAYSLGVCLEGG